MSDLINVLLIDDNPFDRELVRETLIVDNSEFKLIEVASRPELEKILETSEVDIVLTDYNILEYSGLEITDLIFSAYPGLPVIMLTGTGSEEVAVEALKRGVSDYVVKTPSHIKRLPLTISKVLALKKLRREKEEATKRELAAKGTWERTFNTIGDPILILNPDLTIKQYNSTAAKLSDSPEELLGKHCYELFADIKDICPGCRIKNGTSLQAPMHFEVTHSLKKRTFQVNLFPLFDAENKIIEIVHCAKDVTEQKILSEQLFQSQKMESIGKLAGGIAHDFNNILTVINIHAEVALMELEKESELWVDVDEIRKAGERAANLTRQLLAFSRKQMIMPRALNINHLISNMEKMLGRLISEDIKLEFNLGKKVGKIHADPSQLDQIIMNLVVNARDAIKNRPETSKKSITISTSEVFLDKNYVAENLGSSCGRHLKLQVEDSGCGMTREVQRQVFEPFFTTKEIGQGTGLGLATVYGIVKQNQGSINVYSKPGRGTTFKIYWPVMQEEEAETTENQELTTTIGGSEVILLAEDSDQLRKISCRRLREAGYTVIEASHGKEALDKIKNYPDKIDLLFSDVIMPIMGGKELSEKIRVIYPDIAILFTSGYTDKSIQQGLLTSENESFINKPYSTNEILINIRRLLDSKA